MVAYDVNLINPEQSGMFEVNPLSSSGGAPDNRLSKIVLGSQVRLETTSAK